MMLKHPSIDGIDGIGGFGQERLLDSIHPILEHPWEVSVRKAPGMIGAINPGHSPNQKFSAFQPEDIAHELDVIAIVVKGNVQPIRPQ